MKKLKLTKEQWLGIARHGLTFLGGILVTNGLINEALWSEISGAALALISGVWSVLSKS